MKLTKSNLAKKLIIILIALMVFNMALPQEVKAWDMGGILLKPLYMGILGFVVNVDVTLGIFLNGINAATSAVGGVVEALMEWDGTEILTGFNDFVSKILIGPDTIFSGKVQMFDANIFDYIESHYEAEGSLVGNNTGTEVVENIAMLITSVVNGQSKIALYATAVAKLYVMLRNVCALVMLAGLIYTGIRILLSANVPTKKGQYLTILQDWLVGLVLLVFSHLIMILVFKMSDALTEALGLYINGFGGLNVQLILRCVASFDSATQLICLVMLIYMIWLTVIFAISYGKRFFWVCLLIIMAPVFSTLYAFGQQTKSMYSRWLKEYMSIVLIQPFHMLVYSTLVAIPLSIGGKDTISYQNINGIIYSLGAMSMIRPAEKYLRSLLGMDQGIASVASYDSGKQTFDAIKKAVVAAGKLVVAAAATVATGGAAAPVAGKLLASTAVKGAATKFLGKKGAELATNMLTQGGGKAGETVNKIAGLLRPW